MSSVSSLLGMQEACIVKVFLCLNGQGFVFLERVSKEAQRIIEHCYCVLNERWGLKHLVADVSPHKFVFMHSCRFYCKAAWVCFPELKKHQFPIEDPCLVRWEVGDDLQKNRGALKLSDQLLSKLLAQKENVLDVIQTFQMLVDAGTWTTSIDLIKSYNAIHYQVIAAYTMDLMDPTAKNALTCLMRCDLYDAFLHGCEQGYFALPSYFCRLIGRMREPEFKEFFKSIDKSFLSKHITKPHLFLFKTKEQFAYGERLLKDYLRLVREESYGDEGNISAVLNECFVRPPLISFVGGIMTCSMDYILYDKCLCNIGCDPVTSIMKQLCKHLNSQPLQQRLVIIAFWDAILDELENNNTQNEDGEELNSDESGIPQIIENFKNSKGLECNDSFLFFIFEQLMKLRESNFDEYDLADVAFEVSQAVQAPSVENMLYIIHGWMRKFCPWIRIADSKIEYIHGEMDCILPILIRKMDESSFQSIVGAVTPDFIASAISSPMSSFETVISTEVYIRTASGHSLTNFMDLRYNFAYIDEIAEKLSSLLKEYFIRCRNRKTNI